MKIDKKGYTLVELIICIAIVAALGVAATFGLQKVLKTNKINTYKNDLKILGAAGRQYIVINRIPDSSTMNHIDISELVAAGLVSDDIYDKINGLKCRNFAENTKVYFDTDGGQRKIYMKNDDGEYCNLENMENDADCTIKEDC